MDSERVLFPIVIKKEIMWELWKELVSKKGWPKKHSLFNTAIYTNRLVNKLNLVKNYLRIMNKKISVKITIILIMTVILTVPSTMLQISQAQISQSDQNTILSMHNDERKEVNSPPLTWSSNLATQSQDYANQLSTMGLVCNAQQCDQTPHGASNENLAGGSPGTSIATHVQGWADEKSDYNGQPIPSGNNPAGHYTAMVWQNTKEIGCGFTSTDQMNFLVCRYNPPGNFVGEMPYGNANQARY